MATLTYWCYVDKIANDSIATMYKLVFTFYSSGIAKIYA